MVKVTATVEGATTPGGVLRAKPVGGEGLEAQAITGLLAIRAEPALPTLVPVP